MNLVLLPAFAIKGINKILSEEYIIKNLLLDIGFSVGFIMPFFGLAEEISALVINRWSVVNNGVAILFSFGDSLLGGFLKKYLENTLEGRQFLKIYNYVTFMYGLKDAKGAFPLYENFKSMGKLSSADYEFLLSAYGTYSKTDDFKELKKIDEGQYKRIENELNKISEYYDEIIK